MRRQMENAKAGNWKHSTFWSYSSPENFWESETKKKVEKKIGEHELELTENPRNSAVGENIVNIFWAEVSLKKLQPYFESCLN